MLPLAPLAFPLTCPAMRPRGVGAVCHDADESAVLARLEAELEAQVSAAGCLQGLTLVYFQLNLSALYGIGGARRGSVARVKGVLGVVQGV
jgi:hypothetical protein